MQRVWATGLFICLTAQLVLCYTITLFYAVPVWRSTSTPNTVFRNWAVQTKPRGFLAKWCGMDVAWQDYIHSVFIASAICRMYGPWGWHHEFAHGRDSWYVVMSINIFTKLMWSIDMFGSHLALTIMCCRGVRMSLLVYSKFEYAHVHLSSPS